MVINEVRLEVCSQMLFLIGHVFSCLFGCVSSLILLCDVFFSKDLQAPGFYFLFVSAQMARFSFLARSQYVKIAVPILNQSGSMVSSSSSPGWCPDVGYEDIDAMLKDLEDPVRLE